MWSVRTYNGEGKFTGYIRFRDRTAWTKRTAKRHAADFAERHGGYCKLESND